MAAVRKLIIASLCCVGQVHGLFGSRANWKAIAAELSLVFSDDENVLFHVSEVNEFKKTYHGIDGCGDRLVQEILDLVARHPGLEELSVIGHSMGGLIARYAIGRLFDPGTGLMAGQLRPVHFISMACPHCGCVAEQSHAQVPLIGWAARAPLVGSWLHGVLGSIAPGFCRASFLRSGEQFFLADRDSSGGLPLLARMAHDDEGLGVPFFSALAAFQTRTAYANVAGDHLVGWANASLRSLDELPELDIPQGAVGAVPTMTMGVELKASQ